MRIIILVLIVILSVGSLRGQTERLDSIQVRLERVVHRDSAYFSEIDISVGKLSLGEFFRTIARVNGVNLCYKVNEDQEVTCNFNRARVDELLFFLCKEYNLELEVVGNIVSITTPLPPVNIPREPRIEFDSVESLLSYDLLEDNLVSVIKLVSSLTGVQVVVPRSLYDYRVSGYVNKMPVDEALPVLASMNNLEIFRSKKGTWTLVAPEGPAGSEQGKVNSLYRPRRNFSPDQVSIDSSRLITASINKGNVHDIVLEICSLLGLNRVFLTSLDQETALHVKGVDLYSLFRVLFAGTPFTYKEEDGVFLFGSATKNKDFATTRVIPMCYRSVDKVIELIPTVLKNGMQVQLFPDQNSVIATGSSRQVDEVERFLKSIDRSVPLVTIEVLIVNSKKSVIHEVGITAGIGEKPTQTLGTISPGVSMSLSANSINKLINSFNGFGSINLGKVTPDFYMSLKALEEAGNIELRSTPKLSTLNGHEATLKSGETKYYKEVQNNYYGSQIPVPTESYTWKNVEANLTLKIIPFVSLDGKITLTIEIEQSEFTAREEKDAPPGTATRSFKSLVHVRNEEMVLLGGLDRNSKEKTSSGLPFLARVPVLKWLFGSMKNNKVDEKLNVFIKPTVVY